MAETSDDTGLKQKQEVEISKLRAQNIELERQLEEVKRMAALREEELGVARTSEVAQRERFEADIAQLRSQLRDERRAAQKTIVQDELHFAAAPAPGSGNGSEEFDLPDFVWSCGNSEVMAFVQRIVAENAELRRRQVASATVGDDTAAEKGVLGTQASALASSPFNTREVEANRATFLVGGITENDGHQIPTLLEMLRENSSNLQICSQVCSALETLTFAIPENRLVIVTNEGIKAIVGLMVEHQGADAVLLRPVMDALWNLTFEDEAVDSATEAGAVEHIVALMRSHGNEAELLGPACAVLLNLAVREQNRWKIVESGGVALVASAMQQHAQNEEVLELGCQALYMLAYHQDLRPLVLAARGADAAALAASCPRGGGRAQKWGRWLQEVLAC